MDGWLLGSVCSVLIWLLRSVLTVVVMVLGSLSALVLEALPIYRRGCPVLGKHYCMKDLFAWILEVRVLVTRFLCVYLALWRMVLGFGSVPAAMIYNLVYNARSWRRLVLGRFSYRRGRLVLGYVASGRPAVGSICRGHLDLGHLSAIVVAWFLELYLLS